VRGLARRRNNLYGSALRLRCAHVHDHGRGPSVGLGGNSGTVAL
jgi:hypothetical protein